MTVPAGDPLADLRPTYLTRLRGRADELAAFVTACAATEADEERRQTCHRAVHSMISSAAVFGYADLSRCARTAEQLFEKDADQATVIAALETLLAATFAVLDTTKESVVQNLPS
jgi:chemotaxis protein histidine kinase CheA